MSAARPLVAITRPAEAATGLSALLREAGCEVMLAPAIRRVAPSSWEGLDRGIESLESGAYRGLLFTSPASVEAFVSRVHGVPVGLLIGAVGRGTASALEAAGLSPSVISEKGTGADLARAVASHLGAAVHGAAFLLPRAAEGREELASGLAAAGARVDVVEAYRTIRAGADELAELVAGLRAGRIAAVIFASPSAVEAVLAAAGSVVGAAAVAIGETTAGALRDAGVHQVHVATAPDDAGLLRATLQAIGRA